MFPSELASRERRWIRIASFLLLFRILRRQLQSWISKAVRIYIYNFPLGIASRAYWPLRVAVLVSRTLNPLLEKGINRQSKTQVMEWGIASITWLALITVIHREDSVVGNLWFVRWPASLLTTFYRKMIWLVVASQLSAAQQLYSIPLRGLFHVRYIYSLASEMGGMALKEYIDDYGVLDWWYGYGPFWQRALSRCTASIVMYMGTQLLIRGVVKYFWGSGVMPWFDGTWTIFLIGVVLLQKADELRRSYRWYRPRRRATPPSPAESSPYTYDPLAPDKSTIRLLLVHPRHRDAPISCTLFEVELKHAPRYDAISYRWVHDKNPPKILVNGCAFPVASNVYELLQDFRSSLLPRLLWIDSICINQQLDGEKSRQVQLMGEIYESASLVTVWLGSPSLETSRSMMEDFGRRMQTDVPPRVRDLVTDIFGNGFGSEGNLVDRTGESSDVRNYRHKIFSTLFAIHAFRLVDQLRITTTSQKADHKAYVEGAGYRRTPLWTPLMHLLEHEWFGRVWVAQEVVLATSARVVYGRVYYDWGSFIDGLTVLASNVVLAGLMEWTDDKIKRTPVRSLHLSNLSTLQEWRRRRLESGLPLFKEVVFNARLLKSGDPRDKVFGIQGLSAKSDHNWTNPDYTKGVADVYVGAAHRVIHENGILELLSQAGIGYIDEPSPGVDGIPSWVPDWSLFPHALPLGYVNRRSNYRAGGTEGGDTHERVETSLLLRGNLLDVIAEVAPPRYFNLSGDAAEWGLDEMRSLLVALVKSWDLIESSKLVKDPYEHTKKHMPLQEVFWRLLIGDRTDTDWPAPPAVEALFGRWLEGVKILSEPGLENRINEAATDTHLKETMPGRKYLALMAKAWQGRRVAITRKGYVCLIPRHSKEGDAIWLIDGAQTPCVVRTLETTAAYKFAGDCYVHGIMDGSAFVSGGEREVIKIV